MQKIIILIIIMCSVLLGFIFYQESLSSRKKKDLTSVYDKTWLTDFDQAVSIAKNKKIKILMVFTGSDWCPPCKSLHQFIFKDSHFITFAKKNLVLLVVDFPKRRKLAPALFKHNAELKNKFSPMGFPTMIMLNAEGNEMGRFPYMRQTPKEFTEKISQYIK